MIEKISIITRKFSKVALYCSQEQWPESTSSFTHDHPSAFLKARRFLKSWYPCASNSMARRWHCSIATESTVLLGFTSRQRNMKSMLTSAPRSLWPYNPITNHESRITNHESLITHPSALSPC